MGTQFISLQAPPRNTIANYDRTKPWNSQPATIPKTFLEAMSIRDQVFVNEQNVPLENELDADDSRAWHWVVYASVGGMPPPPDPNDRGSSDPRKSTATSLPVGTIRLVPPPHPPHPSPGSSNQIDNSEDHTVIPIHPGQAAKVHTNSTHNPKNEPFVKIGRLATLKDFRKLGLSKLLMAEAMKWASEHSEDILPPMKAADVEAANIDGIDIQPRWHGLVLVHAQVQLEAYYKKLGFVKDEGLGEWDEEGIMHIGMWRRLKVKR